MNRAGNLFFTIRSATTVNMQMTGSGVWMLAVFTGLASSLPASAQDAKPRIALYPLQVQNFSKRAKPAELDSFGSLCRRAVVEAGGELPGFGTARGAVSDMKEKDCATNDKCLQELTQILVAPFALHVALEMDGETQLVARGRVVSESGKRLRDEATVRLDKGKQSYGQAVTAVFLKLFETLQIAKLNSTSQEPDTLPTPVAVAPPAPVKVEPPASELSAVPPRLAVYPLQIANLPKGVKPENAEPVSQQFRRLLTEAGAKLPEMGSMRGAVSDLKQLDCAHSDACLRQLAQMSRVLYAIYVELDVSNAGDVLATGRVVQDDGQRIRSLMVARVPMGKQPYAEAAKAALRQLFERLQLGSLPAVRTELLPPREVVLVDTVKQIAKPADVPKVVPVAPAPVVATAVDQAQPETSSAGPTALMVGGAIGAAGGVVALILSANDYAALNVKDGNVTQLPAAISDAATAKAYLADAELKGTVGGVAVGVGLAAVTGGILWSVLTASDKVPMVAFGGGVSKGEARVTMSGRF